MSLHIGAKKEDIASIVLTARDPLRVKYIAEKYLKEPRLVNNIRMNLGYTGYYKNTLITVISSGMGMGSMGIFAHELFSDYDVQKIIRIGSCGSYFEEIGLNDIVIAEKAYSTSNFAFQESGKDINLVKSAPFLNQKIIREAHNDGIEVRYGTVCSTDLFYRNYDDPGIRENYCLVEEMECFALFYEALKFEREASAVLTVSDNLKTQERLSALDREQSFDKAILLVLDTVSNNL